MRILAITNLYPNPFEPNRGPFNRAQMRALARDHAVRVISPIAWFDELRARWRGATAMPASRLVECDGVAVEHPRYFYTPRLFRGSYGHFYRHSIRGAFDRALAEFCPDLVYATWAYPDGWAAVDLGHRAGLPVVVKVHGCDVLWGLRHNPDKQPRTRETLQRADAIVAVSQDLATEVARLGASPDRVQVVYNGVDGSVFHPGSLKEARTRLGIPLTERIILFVGALVPVKGIDVLLQACARLKKQGESFRCCLVGEGPLRADLVQQAIALGIGDSVTFVGTQPHGQIGDWYRAASVLVLPSHSEGVPCVLMEGIACGAPFVATRVGGIPEVADRGHGQLVPPADPAALAAALADQLGRPGSSATPAIRSHEDAAFELAGWLDKVAWRYRSAHAA